MIHDAISSATARQVLRCSLQSSDAQVLGCSDMVVYAYTIHNTQYTMRMHVHVHDARSIDLGQCNRNDCNGLRHAYLYDMYRSSRSMDGDGNKWISTCIKFATTYTCNTGMQQA